MKFHFDGDVIEARDGETIAAALVRSGRIGGYFCGIGVCFGCLVTIDGTIAQRACLALARPNTDVHPDPLPHRPAFAPPGSPPSRTATDAIGQPPAGSDAAGHDLAGNDAARRRSTPGRAGGESVRGGPAAGDGGGS